MALPFFKPRNPDAPRLSPVQRIIGVGANMLFPGAGIATRALFQYQNNNTVGGIYNGLGSGYSAADRAAINGPAISSANLGFGRGPDMSQYYGARPQPGSTTTNQQLAQSMEQMLAQRNHQRIEAARGNSSTPIGDLSRGRPAPRENMNSNSARIRNESIRSNPYDGMIRWEAANDINERVRGMVQ